MYETELDDVKREMAEVPMEQFLLEHPEFAGGRVGVQCAEALAVRIVFAIDARKPAAWAVRAWVQECPELADYLSVAMYEDMVGHVAAAMQAFRDHRQGVLAQERRQDEPQRAQKPQRTQRAQRRRGKKKGGKKGVCHEI